MELKYEIKINDTKLNVKEILKREFNISNRVYQNLLKNQSIKINNFIYYEKQNINLNKNDIIKINFNYPEDNSNIVPTKMNLNIEYEDDWLLIVNKPSGIPVHPSILHFTDSLSNGIKYYYDSIGLKKQIRPVNRIDSNTSGLVVFAKCKHIHSVLSLQMQNKIFKKKYLAIILGSIDKKKGTINLPIDRKPNSIIERCVSPTGQKSITNYKVLDTKHTIDPSTKVENIYSLIECDLETGRTHQIRVHFSHLGHPILGDSLYGQESTLIDGQALHSYYISFIHPITGKLETFISKPNWNIFHI